VSTDTVPAESAWIAPLLERYRTVVGHGAGTDAATGAHTGTTTRVGDPAFVDAFNTLRLADALLDKVGLSDRTPDHPVQIALLGPTQSGKSTLANLLLDANAAGISALAGYTVHATGLATGLDEAELAPLVQVLAPLHRTPRRALDPEALDTFALELVVAGPAALVSRSVVWDTPDFDSIEAGGYRGAVLQGMAIADVLVLVVSKDKYGDRTVWDMLDVLHDLGRPLLICINKLDAGDEDTVVRAFTTRFDERFGAPPRLLTLPFVRGGAARDTAPTLPAEPLARLGEAVEGAIGEVDRDAQRDAAATFVARRRAGWLAPLGHELAAAAEWERQVADVLAEAEEDYVRRYLDDPRKYDTFNRALAELLALLELPGVARVLARTRDLVTWPARTLLGLGRRQLGGERAAAPDQEEEILEAVLERALTRLQGVLIEQRETADEQLPWWRAAHVAFRERRPLIVARFEDRSAAVRLAFEPRIEEAARSLYERLRTQPALLGTLRAARVTTDAAGVALAVKSGGLAPADLVLAPAMLSVTTLLTESALGRYLDTVRRELQAEQRSTVRRELLDAVLGEALGRLARELDDGRLLGAGLDPAVWAAADVGGPRTDRGSGPGPD